MFLKPFLIVLITLKLCYSAKILGVISFPSYSHQMFYRPLWRELSLRGHQVTIITTDPMNDTSLTNLTEINTHVTYEALARHNILDAAAEASLGAAVSLLGGLLQDLTKTHFNVLEVRKLINSDDAEFDLVMFETQIFAAPIVYSWRFKCPSIGVTSFDAAMEYHYNLGNLVHPVVNPDFNLYVKNTSHMSYFERVKSTVYSVLLNYYMYNYYYPVQEDVLRGFFGSTMPSLWEMTKNVSMLFIGTHPVLHDVRPINPHTITLSTIYLKPKKPLPTSIQQYLEESQNGVIYFSLGTNVKENVFNSEKKNAILEAFAELPYNVLMKAQWVDIRIPKNVRMEKWLPQHDILRHKNVKLFITQGGINSLTESLSSGVPVLIIPFFGDQLTNTQKAIKMGYGLKLDKNHITTENVKEKVTTLITNPKYRERANELGKILLDQPISDLDKAVYWVEYVIRYKGAHHLRSNATDLPLYQYYLLDVLMLFLAITIVLLVFMYRPLKMLLKYLRKVIVIACKKFFLWYNNRKFVMPKGVKIV